MHSALLYPLNFLLFKSDQLALPFLADGHASDAIAAKFAFLCKWPDLVSSVTSLVGAPLYPKLYIRHGETFGHWSRWKRHEIEMAFGYGLVCVLGTWAYVALWVGRPIGFMLVVPYALQAMLILPVNLAIYSLLRAECLQGALMRLGICLLLGSPAIVIVILKEMYNLYPWVVPFQLLLLIISLFVAPWGARQSVYAIVQSPAL
jgi:hypothetical protein